MPPNNDGIDEHLVRVHLPFNGTDEDFDRWCALEDVLDDAAQAAGVGSLDGNEIGEGEYTIWLYGPSAQALAEVVREALSGYALPPECYLYLRHGGVEDDAAPEETWPLS